MKWTLVYFDDQVQNIEAFKEFLADDFEVVGCNDSTQFSKILQENNPHAFLLDVHMPVMDGHELYKNISAHPLYNGCPFIFISGDESDENRIKSYQSGGVDFIPRGVNIEEIIIRLKNKIKFYLQMSPSLEFGNLNLNVSKMKASIENKNIDLTLLEFRLLSHIFRAFPNTLTRAGLIQKVWGGDSVKPGTINTHLTNLKSKIETWDHQIKVRDENVLVLKK